MTSEENWTRRRGRRNATSASGNQLKRAIGGGESVSFHGAGPSRSKAADGGTDDAWIVLVAGDTRVDAGTTGRRSKSVGGTEGANGVDGNCFTSVGIRASRAGDATQLIGTGDGTSRTSRATSAIEVLSLEVAGQGSRSTSDGTAHTAGTGNVDGKKLN